MGGFAHGNLDTFFPKGTYGGQGLSPVAIGDEYMGTHFIKKHYRKMPETMEIKQVFSNLYSIYLNELFVFRFFNIIIGTNNRDLMGNP
jgi:hypothetical protein